MCLKSSCNKNNKFIKKMCSKYIEPNFSCSILRKFKKIQVLKIFIDKKNSVNLLEFLGCGRSGTWADNVIVSCEENCDQNICIKLILAR